MIDHPFQYPHTDAEVAANPWVEIDAKRAMYFLEVLPPARWKDRAFAVGEPLCHLNDGRIVHRVVVEVGNKSYTKPYPIEGFDPMLFACEVRRQFGLGVK